MDVTLESLVKRTQSVRSSIDRNWGYVKALAEQGTQLQSDIETLKGEIIALEKAIIVLNSLSETKQINAQQQIEALVTRGLQVVFGSHMSFHMTQDVKARQPTVEFYVRTTYADGSYMETDVMGASGGGLASIVGFVLRIVTLLLRPEKRAVVIFDEPFSALSDGFADKLVEFIKELIEKSPLQAIIVAHTHVQDLAEIADKRYRLVQVKGLTEAAEF